MKKTLIVLIFLMLCRYGFGQGAVIYNGLSHEYQAAPQKRASEYGPMSSGWQWQNSSFGSFSPVSNESILTPSAAATQSSPVPLPSSYTASTAKPAFSEQKNFFSNNPLAAGNRPSYFEQEPALQLRTPSIHWKFARPQQELEPVMPVVPGREDEAASNNPGIVVQGEPNAAVVAKDGERPGIIAEEGRNTVNWKYTE